LNSACQFVLVCPTALALDLIIYENSEIWVSLGNVGFGNLVEHCSIWVLLGIIGFSLLCLGRPVAQYFGSKRLSVGQQLNVQAAGFFLFIFIGQIISTKYLWMSIN
jgi:lipid-A-disaccharide synthase-like uncharacterized protein